MNLIKPKIDFDNPVFVQYWQRQKAMLINYALNIGFDVKYNLNYGDEHTALRRNYIHIMGGLQYGGLEAYKFIRTANENYIFVDGGYLLAKNDKYDMHKWNLRVVPNAYHQHWISQNQNISRLHRLMDKGLVIKPWQMPKHGYILLIPPSSPAVEALFDLNNWIIKMQQEIVLHTKRPIIIRSKGNPVPLETHLQGAFATVCWTSNVGVDSILAGVPVFCSDFNAARPVSLPLTALNQIENPRYPDRMEWLISLACNQFTVDEIGEGYAKEIVMKEMKARHACSN